MRQSRNVCIMKAATEAGIQKCFEVRQEVFVNEQSIAPELVFDELDSGAVHYLVTEDDKPVASVRAVVKDGGKAAKIGRLAVIRTMRGQGLAKALMGAIEADEGLKGVQEFVLNAQSYIVPLYRALGYEVEGGEFMEAGIPHRHMIKRNACPLKAC